MSQEREKIRRRRQPEYSGTLEERYERPETLQSILIDLGSSMADHGQVPSPDGQQSPSSSTTTSIFRRPSEVATDTNTPLSTPNSSHPGSLYHVRQPSSSRDGSSFALPINDLQLPGLPPLVPPTLPSSIPPLRHKRRVNTDLTPDPPSLAESTLLDDQDVSIAPQIATKARASRASGYINTPSGLVEITVKVTEMFPENAISVTYAKLLGLNIQPHSGSVDGTRMLANFYSNNEEVVSTGDVILEWRGASATPPFNVKCKVFPGQLVDLVFGHTFLERRSFYAMGGEDKDGGEWMR